jgi:hypothetical protein
MLKCDTPGTGHSSLDLEGLVVVLGLGVLIVMVILAQKVHLILSNVNLLQGGKIQVKEPATRGKMLPECQDGCFCAVRLETSTRRPPFPLEAVLKVIQSQKDVQSTRRKRMVPV